MKILTAKDIKTLEDGDSVPAFTGEIHKIKPPIEPNEHDKARNRQRQLMVLMDPNGDMLDVQLTREKQHLTPAEKGRTLVLQSTPTDDGPRGLELNRWEGNKGVMHTLIIHPAATIFFEDGKVEGEQPEAEAHERPEEAPAPEAAPPVEKVAPQVIRSKDDIVSAHALVMEACWNAIDFVDDDSIRKSMASTLFIELGRKGLVKGEAERLRQQGMSRIAEKISAQPQGSDISSPTPEPETPDSKDPDWEVEGAPDDAPEDTPENELKMAEADFREWCEAGNLHVKFGEDAIERAITNAQKKMGADTTRLETLLVLAKSPHNLVVEEIEKAHAEIEAEDEIPMM